MSLLGSTPNPADAFSRFMAGVFDEKKLIGVPTGFQAFFGRAESGSETLFSPDANTVDIDIVKGNEKIAALIPRGTVSRPLGSRQKNAAAGKMYTFSRKFPLAEEEGDINADQLLYRLPGENPYARMTRLDRMRELGMKIHTENIRRTIRMFEVLAAQSVLEGKQDAIIGTSDTDLQYDFRRDANHTFSVPAVWDAGTPNILGDIDTACDLIRQNGHVAPDFIGFGGDAINAFISDTTAQELADNRRFELIEVSSNNPVPTKFARFVEAGWTPRGRLRTPQGYELWIFTYIDVYTNTAGNPVKYMPDDKVFVASTQARCDRYFGPPESIPMLPQRVQLYQDLFGFDPGMAPMPLGLKAPGNTIDPAMFYIDAYVAGNWKAVTIRTQAAPIFATTHTDAFVVMDGMITP